MVGRHYYEFGHYRLDPSGRLLTRQGERIPLPPKAADTLLLLVENAGNVVEKDDLLKRIWPDTFVEEGSLTRTIFILRKALAESAEAQQHIVTIPKRGYCFAAPVKQDPDCIVPPPAEKIMLAVLPFEDLSGDKKQEYFSDGLTEEMITQLGRLSPDQLGVIARTSAMRYKRTEKSIARIGRELGVSYIMEGSVRREGNRVRISAQLIRVSDQTHAWAEIYERDMRNILTLQSDVARAIATQIRIKLTPQEIGRLPRIQPVNVGAYEDYLKGRYCWNQRKGDSVQRAIGYFQRSIEKDSGCTVAHAGLADCYLTLLDDHSLSPIEAITKAGAAVETALRLDEALAEAHTSLAHLKFHKCDWSAAEKEFKRAIELNPSYPVAHFYYANFLLATGQLRDALAEAQEARALDPASVVAHSNLSAVFYNARQYDQSLEQARAAVELDPKAARPHYDLARPYEQKEMHRQAIAAFQRAVALSGRGTRYITSLGHAYAVAGKKRQALNLLRELRQLSRKQYVSPYDMALLSAGLGEKDDALAWLMKAYEERSATLPFLKVEPRFDPIRSEPRYQELLRRTGLVP